MRIPLRRVSIAVTVLIVLLLANLTYIQVVKASDYRSSPYNKRTLLSEYSRPRGQITAQGGVVLARSQPVNDQYRYQRLYPGGAMYANLTGYYSLRYGPSGLERAQNSILSGDDPELLGTQLSDLITGRDPRGGNIELTIVPAVQKAAYDGLASRHYAGAVVAIRPSTGQILAMASTPSFDPNPLASHSESVQRKAYNAIAVPPDSDTPSPMIDRTIEAVYPPGSTFKLVTSAAALQHGYTPDTMVTGAPKITLPGTAGATLSNFDGEDCAGAGGADVTLTQALAFSCNTAYAQVAMSVGADAMRAQATALGVATGPTTVGGLEVAASRLGALPDQAALAQSGIGQRDVALTPLQNAEIVATVANRGMRMKPQLIERTTRPDLSVISQFSPVSLGQAIPGSVADEIRTMMIASEGETKGAGSIAGVQIASKTGTAEHGLHPKTTPPQCWYVAFAPAANPQVAVAVLVENGGDGNVNAVGATVAAPIGREVIAAALGGG